MDNQENIKYVMSETKIKYRNDDYYEYCFESLIDNVYRLVVTDIHGFVNKYIFSIMKFRLRNVKILHIRPSEETQFTNGELFKLLKLFSFVKSVWFQYNTINDDQIKYFENFEILRFLVNNPLVTRKGLQILNNVKDIELRNIDIEHKNKSMPKPSIPKYNFTEVIDVYFGVDNTNTSSENVLETCKSEERDINYMNQKYDNNNNNNHVYEKQPVTLFKNVERLVLINCIGIFTNEISQLPNLKFLHYDFSKNKKINGNYHGYVFTLNQYFNMKKIKKINSSNKKVFDNKLLQFSENKDVIGEIPKSDYFNISMLCKKYSF